MTGLIRFILIFAVFYYGFKLIGRYLIPWILKKQINKMSQQQGNAYEQTKEAHKKKEGKVTVHYQSNESKKGNASKSGDYVDFEEIKD